MATIPGAAAGDVSIPMPSSADAAVAGGEQRPPREVREGKREGGGGSHDDNDDDDSSATVDYPEKQLTRFVRSVVLGEWVGNVFGTLALAWASTVLLGGFCSDLNRQDFRFATFMIFVECIRVFSRHYKSDSQYLFGSTRALRWISSASFPCMLVRPQQGNQLVLIMGLCFSIIQYIPEDYTIAWALMMTLLILWIWRPQLPQQWQMRAVAIAYLLFAAYTFIRHRHNHNNPERMQDFRIILLPVTIEAGASVLLLLNLRCLRGLANLTTAPWGRRLISFAKVTSALWLVAELVLMWYPEYVWNRCWPILRAILSYFWDFNKSITMLILSLGSLQKHTADSLFGRCTDAILHIFFLSHFLLPFPRAFFDIFAPGYFDPSSIGVSFLVVLVLLLSANLQIPTAAAQITLSSMRLLLSDNNIDYSQQLMRHKPNMVPALQVFYVLALCQGALYIMASFLSLFSSLPQRWLIQRSKFGGKLAEKAIDLYYHHAYVSRIEIGVFGARSMITSFADFAIDSLSSSTSSRDLRVAGLYVLHNILLERRSDSSTKDLILRITSGSGIAVSSTLIGMLAWAADVEEDGYAIRLLAARVIAELASSLRISSIPGMLKPVSSLLKLDQNDDAGVLVPNQQQGPAGHQRTPLAIANGGSVQLAQRSSNGGCRSCCCSLPQRTLLAIARYLSEHLCRFWQRMKEKYWSIPEEPTLSHQDSPPVLGMVILEKLARHLDNCVEIFKDDTTNLISKTIGIIGLATSDNDQSDALVCLSLEFLRRLATTGERIGTALRHELWSHPFLLTCLARVLEDDRNGSPRLWLPAMDIIAKLALDSAAGHEIGRNQVITARLLHAFLGQNGTTNMYYDQFTTGI